MAHRELPLNGPRRGPNFYFMRIMIEEIEKGYTPGSTFTRENQLYVNRKFRLGYGESYTDEYLMERFKHLKREYHDFSELLNQTGIYWDKKSNTVYGNEKLLRSKYMHLYRNGIFWGEPNFELSCQVFESGVKFE